MFKEDSNTILQPYLMVLALLFLTIMLASTSVAYKPLKIWIFSATASSLLFASTFAISSVIAEIYGQHVSKVLINIIIPCGLLFSAIVSLISHLPSPQYWHHQKDFNYVFGDSFRFAVFGTIGSIVSFRVNTYLISKWKFLTKGRYFPLRVIGANTCGEFFLVLITTFGGFYNIFSLHVVFKMFLFAYLSKIVYAFFLSWPAAFLASYIKNHQIKKVCSSAS